MKQQLFALFFLAVTSYAWAQKNGAAIEPLNKLDVGLGGVGASFERRLGNQTSLDLSASLGGGYEISSRDFTYHANLKDVTAQISISPRFYFNRRKRLEKGKPLLRNSGDYLGIKIKYATRGLSENSSAYDALLFNLHWGIQRAIAKRWTVNTIAGVGYGVDATDLNHAPGAFYPAFDLKFSYIL